VGLELLLLSLIVVLTAYLVNAQPARETLALPFSTEVHAGPNVLVDVVVDPAKTGPVAIHLYTLSPDGGQLDVPEVTATMSLASAGITDLVVPLQKGGTGHFLVGGFDVPLKGTWTMNITVRTTAFDEFYASGVQVRMR
jgi:copper transport protein